MTTRAKTGRGRQSNTSRELGGSRPIPRRDFVQGALAGVATALTAPLLTTGSARAAVEVPVSPVTQAVRAAQDLPGYYPPLLTGMRGSHPGSFEAAHALRDGAPVSAASDTGEVYDLVVVGGGISGLSAAHFFRAQTTANSRILILDNHDDFGGHAKRNEFELNGRVDLMNGGAEDIDSPRPYSAVAVGLLEDLGIDMRSLSRSTQDRNFYERRGLHNGVFFDRETFGADKLVIGYGSLPIGKVIRHSPLSVRARVDIARIEEGSIDYLPGIGSEEKKLLLSRISYRDFLRDMVRADPAAIAFYQARTHDWWGVGIDAVSALDCWAFKIPGFKGMDLPAGSIGRMGYTAAGYLDTGGSTFLHFPDGNATVARLLVRTLVPSAVPGSTATDVVTARVDYGRLDQPSSAVRLRLNSTAVRVQHVGDDPGTSEVRVTYMRNGTPFIVRARGCVLACWNMAIPYLCPDLPPKQKSALHELVKAPLVYASVALRNWQAFDELGTARIHAPGSYFTEVALNPKVDVGTYQSRSTPDQPILLWMEKTPCQPGLPERDQNRVGRAQLLATSFETFEYKIRDQLARMLGPGGFDPARDIEAITVNRWPHGYAHEYNPLFDPDVPESQRANVIGRTRFGRITIANADSAAKSYMDNAIDQAHRAVRELVKA